MKEETFNVTTSRGTELEVTVGIKNEGYGWFELYDVETGGERVYAEGGLWFSKEGDTTYLRDYDGVFELPDYIMDKLVEMGYSMDWI
jgi:hypothetical protein